MSSTNQRNITPKHHTMIKFNCTRANQIPIQDILYKLNLHPVKKTKNEYLYSSPFREERTPSFSVNVDKNKFYDFGAGIGGNNIDLIKKIKNCSVKEALQFFNENFESFSFNQQKNFKIQLENNRQSSKIEIKSIEPLSHPALLEYLKSREITFSKVHEFIQQAYYLVNGKEYFSIALKNDKGGYELKNKFIGNSNSPKYLTSLIRGNNNVIVTEALFDFLSWIELNFNKKESCDFIILNSVAFTKDAIPLIKNYSKIGLYLDNDKAGKEATNVIKNAIPSAIDLSNTYSKYKDLNEFLSSDSHHKIEKTNG